MARTSSTSKRTKSARRGPTKRKTSSSRRSTGGGRRKPKRSLNVQHKALIAGIVLILLTAIAILSLLSPNQGSLTQEFSGALRQIFGWGGLLIPIVLALGGFYLVLWGMEQPPGLPSYQILGIVLLFFSAEAFASLIWVAWDDGLTDVWTAAEAGQGGGYLGGSIVWSLNEAVGGFGAVIILLFVGVIAAILTFGVTLADASAFIQRIGEKRQESKARAKVNDPATAKAADRPAKIRRQPAKTASTASQASKSNTTTQLRPAASSRPDSAPAQERQESKDTGAPSQPSRSNGDEVISPQPIITSQLASQNWELPELSEMLESGGDIDVGDTYIREQVEIIEHTLESFGAPAKVVEINQGPTITQYGVEPSFIVNRSGKRTKVKVGKIASLDNDLALALAARSIRIQAPVPGKGFVGIEVPNSEAALVSLRDVMESEEFDQIQSPISIGLGQNVAGLPVTTDLAQMPHLLIAGTTGSGKSVCVNSLIACLLLQNTPEDLKLVMVDPKRVELTGYNGIPHLVAPVVVDLERVVGTLKWAMHEMDKRYGLLAEMGARNIVEYNSRAINNGQKKLPFIVIVIDELADLMMLSPEETERGITRLAQMARATGIHMVIATQRPSVDVVTGLIKANFPARIAFAVASSTDSRVILDTTGAERLLGQGDMLFQSPDAAAPVRMQGCFVSERELRKIIDFWQRARVANRRTTSSETPVDVAEEQEADGEQQPLWEEMRQVEEDAERYSDELLPEAIALVRQLDKASTSLLQRRFRIGYTRAARMMDVMEEDGIIGPPTGTSKARKVLPYQDKVDEAGQGETESPVN